jgi:subtilisin family serine protease
MFGRLPAWSGPFDPESLEQVRPGLPLAEVTREWAWGGSTGKGVKVAVIDSGIDAAHPAVGPVQGYVSVAEGPDGGMVYEPAPHRDAYGHGTACAGIIRSLAPECELYSVQVLGPQLAGRGPVLLAGLTWALSNGMQVCNLSLGSTKKEFFAALHELTDLAYFRNVLLVTAANNLAMPSFPSVFASVLSVASHAIKEPERFYYNPHPPVEFGAPGIDVRVAWQDGGWITATGNSFAAPHITGLVARLLGKHPDLTPFEVKAVLRALAWNTSAPEAGVARGPSILQ